MEVETLKATILQEWEVEQLLKLRERQPDLIEPALRRLVQENDEIRWSVAVGAYQDRQINLGKAAEWLDMTELELRDRFIELGIPPPIQPGMGTFYCTHCRNPFYTQIPSQPITMACPSCGGQNPIGPPQ